jgi:uncharacterized protein YehS (DUF1456 family)
MPYVREIKVHPMTNNSIFRRIRFIFQFSDAALAETFQLVGLSVSKSQVANWLRKEEHAAYEVISDELLAAFLNGFIVLKRGKKDGPAPMPEKQLSNNLIFRKMRIALNLKDEDIIQILGLVNMKMSAHEINAFFRNPSQRQYVQCNDQVLRNFFQGLEVREQRLRK